MKKRFAALLACALTVSVLAACGGEGATGETGTTEETTTTLAEATITPTVELVTVEGDVLDLSALPVEEYVTLGDYKNLTVAVTPKTEYSEEELEAFVSTYFFNDAAYIAAEDFLTEGVVAEGDVVLMDYEGKLDGVAFDGGTATDATLGIGSGSFIDGFEDGLIGVNVGETVDLNLTFPEVYTNNPDLAGKEVVFTVTVKGVAPLVDEMIAAMGIEGYTTVDDYKNAVKLSVVYNNESAYYEELNTAICEALLEISTINKLPESIYENQKTLVIEQVAAEAAAYGVDGDTYTQAYMGMNLADYAVGVAEAYTSQAVLFQAIANAEGIAPTDEDVDTFVTDYVANNGAASGIDSVETFYEYNTREDVKNLLLQDKVITFLTEHATITDAE